MKTVYGYKLSVDQKRIYDFQAGGFSPYIGVIVSCPENFKKELFLSAIKKIASTNDAFQLTLQQSEYTFYPLQTLNEDYENGFFSDQSMSLNGENLSTQLDEFCHEFDYHPFLVQCNQSSNGEFYLLMRFSSLNFDGVSVRLFINKLNHLFQDPSWKSSETFQYIQYAEWRAEMLSSADNSEELAFWQNPKVLPKKRFSNFGFFINNNNAQQLNELTIQNITVSQGTWNQLESFSNSHNYDMQCLLLGVWILFIDNYVDNGVVEVGLIENKRSYDEFNNILGPISKTIPFSVDTSTISSFDEILKVVKSNLNKLLEQQDYFDPTAIKPEEGKLFKYEFGFEYLCFPEHNKPQNSDFSIVKLKNHAEPFLLKLHCEKNHQGYNLELIYDKSAYISGSLQTIKKAFIGLLKTIGSNDKLNSLTNNFNHLTIEKGFKLQSELIKTETIDIQFKSIIKSFESNVNNYPLNIAFKSVNKALTYIELNKRANQVANYISREYKVTNGCIVAVHVGDNIDQIICILACLKVGSTFLPISSDTPEIRLNLILEDSQPALFITDVENASYSPNQKIYFLDLQAKLENESVTFNNIEVEPVDIAYVIYTSGSTGTPKGVKISHIALSNYVDWFVSRFKLRLSDHTVLLSSISYDLSYTALWPSLKAGSTVFTLQNSDYFDINECMELIANESPLYMKLTPSHFNLMISDDDFFRTLLNSSIRLIVLGGEKIKPDDISKFLSGNSKVQFVNHYGPTETTIGSIYQTITASNIDQYRLKPVIGSPITNAAAYILNEIEEPVKIGSIGEICIAGKGLTKGYLNDDALSNDRMVRIDTLKDTLYKTGDLGRLLPDGTIEFIGRKDDQIKINGHRVEMGEIEQVLINHNKVNIAVAVYEETEKGHLLMAYLDCDNRLSLDEIKAWIGKSLPQYMIPVKFYKIDEIAYKPNGKIERSTLDPNKCVPIGNDTVYQYTPPSNKFEKILVDVWQEVLTNEEIGVTDDFYALGGDSIKALQIISKLYKLGLKLHIKDILEGTNIQGIASRLKDLQHFPKQEEINGLIPLTPIQIEFFNKITNNPNHFNQSVMLSGKAIQANLVSDSFKRLIKHHDILRAKFKLSDGNYSQLCEPYDESNIDFKVIKAKTKREMHLLLTENATKIQAGLDIQDGPLIKIALFKSPPEDRLLIVIHHLLIDGVSWRILLEDFMILYTQGLNKDKLQLNFKSNSYKDWSQQLLSFANPTELQENIDFWNNLIPDKIDLIPTDFNIKVSTIEDDETFNFQMGKRDTTKLIQKMQSSSKYTYEEVLLAATTQAIGHVLSVDNLLLDIEKHGRNTFFDNIDTSRTIGWFTLRFPIVLQSLGKLSPMELLNEILEKIRCDPKHQLAYPVIKYMMKKGEKTENIQSLMPEICFNNLGQFQPQDDLSKLKILDADKGNGADPKTNKRYKIELTTSVFNERLNIYIRASRKHYQPETIKKISDCFLVNLLEYINILMQPDNTKSQNFYLNQLTEDELTSLFD